MGFLFVIIGIWAVAMVAWFMVSKYFKASDIDRVKARLLGTAKGTAAKAKKGAPAEKQVIINNTDSKNQFAQKVVEKYQLGPKLATLMDDSEADFLASMTFPPAHRTKLHSTNPLERLHCEIKRRTEVVGIVPNEAAIARLVGAILLEQNDEWSV